MITFPAFAITHLDCKTPKRLQIPADFANSKTFTLNQSNLGASATPTGLYGGSVPPAVGGGEFGGD
jgi:hypothetical protein